jgi:hypothetical protein
MIHPERRAFEWMFIFGQDKVLVVERASTTVFQV